MGILVSCYLNDTLSINNVCDFFTQQKTDSDIFSIMKKLKHLTVSIYGVRGV